MVTKPEQMLRKTEAILGDIPSSAIRFLKKEKKAMLCNLYEEAVDLYQKDYCTNFVPTYVLKELVLAKMLDTLVKKGEARHDYIVNEIREDFDIEIRCGNAMTLGFWASKFAVRMQLDGLVETNLEKADIIVGAKGGIKTKAKVSFIKATDTLNNMTVNKIIDYYVGILG